MKNLVIYGDSPFAERIYSYIRIEGRDRVVGFVNDESFSQEIRKKALLKITDENVLKKFERMLENNC